MPDAFVGLALPSAAVGDIVRPRSPRFSATVRSLVRTSGKGAPHTLTTYTPFTSVLMGWAALPATNTPRTGFGLVGVLLVVFIVMYLFFYFKRGGR